MGAPETSAPSPAELNALARHVLRLQRGLTGSRELAGAHYMDDPELLGAYLLYYWPVSWAQTTRALRLSGMGKTFRASRVLDIGSGPGPAAAAMLDMGAESVFLMDKSESALQLAKRLLGTSVAAAVRADLEHGFSSPAGPFDIVSMCHVLNELGGTTALDKKLEVIESLRTCMSKTSALLIVEPATLDSSRNLLAVRDRLVSAGWTILSPCTQNFPCPALSAGPQHSCHDQASWTMPPLVEALAQRTGLDRSMIKMSWLLASPYGNAHQAQASAALRVVSDPMLNKAGRTRILVCGQGGRFPLSTKLAEPIGAHAVFTRLKRYDLIQIHKPEAREGGLGLGPDSIIEEL